MRTTTRERELRMEHAEWKIVHASYKYSTRTANRARGMSRRACECSDDPYEPPYDPHSLVVVLVEHTRVNIKTTTIY